MSLVDLGRFGIEDSQTCIFDESSCGWCQDGNADGSDLLDLLGVYGDVDTKMVMDGSVC